VISIYGNSGNFSNARVTLGFLEAFSSNLNLGDIRFFDLSKDDQKEEVKIHAKESSSKLGIFLGSLSYLDSVLPYHKHHELMIMIAPNSDKIGTSLKKLLNSDERISILSPSQWALETLQGELPRKQIYLAPHGVSKTFNPKLNLTDTPDRVRLLHMSSSTLERKGTVELIEAWKEIVEVHKEEFKEISLTILVQTNMLPFYYRLRKTHEIPNENLIISKPLDLDEDRMSKLYSTYDAVIQPSRGEGFGMVPLEARVCGIPAICTTTGGHEMHTTEGLKDGTVVPIQTGPLAPIDDFPSAVAPTVTPSSIQQAIEHFIENKENLKNNAHRHSGSTKSKWLWENKLKEIENVIIQKLRK